MQWILVYIQFMFRFYIDCDLTETRICYKDFSNEHA